MKKLLMITALAFCVGGIAHAQLVSVDTSGYGAAAVNVGGDTATSSVNVNTNVSANGAIGSSSVSGNSSSTTTASTGNGGASVISVGEISVSADDMEDWSEDDKADFLLTVKDHAELRSEQDFETFAKGMIVANANMDEVDADEDMLEVEYEMPARFLGIFQTSLDAEVEVNFASAQNGGQTEDVDAHYPWYRFLFSLKDEVKSDAIKDKVERRLDDRDVAVGATTTTAIVVRNGLVLQTVAGVLNDIRASVDAEMNAEAEANDNENEEEVTVTEAQARLAAQAAYTGTSTIADVDLETENGVRVYRVTFEGSDGKETDILVDAKTGGVVSVKADE
jgi:uncharacterized membrane protein YkoI